MSVQKEIDLNPEELGADQVMAYVQAKDKKSFLRKAAISLGYWPTREIVRSLQDAFALLALEQHQLFVRSNQTARSARRHVEQG